MANVSLVVGYRPLRIGFCVRAGSIQDVVKAVEINTILWGGLYNPIIPVGSDNDWNKQLIKLFGVDLLYPVEEVPELISFIDQFEYLSWPIFPGREIFNLYPTTPRREELAILDISNVIDYHWNNTFKVEQKSNVVVPRWASQDPLAALFAVQFGKIYTSPDLVYRYELAFKERLRANVKRIVNGRNVNADLADAMTPIHLTSDRLMLTGDPFGPIDRFGVYIGDPGRSDDLVNFWNLRAAGSDMSFLPIISPERLGDFMVARLRTDPYGQEDERRNHTTVWYRRDVGEDAVSAVIAQTFGDSFRPLHSHVSDIIWNGLNVRPLLPHFDNKTVLAALDKEGDPVITFELPKKPLIENRYNMSQKFMVSIRPLTEYGYGNRTLRPPFIPDLNHYYGREVALRHDEFRIGKDSINLLTDVKDSNLTLSPIIYEDLMKKIFLRSGIKATQSKPGLIAQRIVESMGGLESCRVFKITGVRKLIDSTSPATWFTCGHATQVIYDQDLATQVPTFNRHLDLHIQKRSARHLSTAEVFNHLIDQNILQSGLVPTCPHCELDFWLPLNQISQQIECEYCGHKIKLAGQLKDRGDWRYRRSGLFGRADNQEGAIPVILTLMHLASRMGIYDSSIYTTGLNLRSDDDQVSCETDFTVMSRDHDGKVSLVIGESKTNGEISQLDIDNLRAVAEKLKPDGLDIYFCFSKTNAFTNDEILRFKSLKESGEKLILFTDRELEPYMMYEYYQKNNIPLPRGHGGSFDDMWINSASLYLS